MISSHPDLETLTRFVRGTLGNARRRELESHLAACATCRETLEAIPPAPGPETVVKWRAHLFEERRRRREQGEESRRDADQTLRGVGAVIGALAEKQVHELLAASEHERRLLIRNEESFRTLALCELLEARCRAAWSVDPEEAADLARLAALVAERLDLGVYGAERVENAKAMAWMHLGNAFRIAAEWRKTQENVSHVAEAQPFEVDSAEPAQILSDAALPRYEIDTALWEMRDAFLARRMGFDAVLVTLDLAAESLREGRVDGFRRMVEESVPLFEESGLQPYTVDAVRFLRDAVRSGEPCLTPDLLTRMVTLLQRARNDPQHRWTQ
ncbi:MAG TPA: zf-HC2 domain-containing protein [Thermoanaerobaculia bacterium]|nr:zf-HC2 domain-containing protein [Thermoanaerobaculia bacterium]